MEKFSISVNIAANSTVTFVLTYEELLQRKTGQYEILTRVTPKQPVQEFQVWHTLSNNRCVSLDELDPSLSPSVCVSVHVSGPDCGRHLWGPGFRFCWSQCNVPHQWAATPCEEDCRGHKGKGGFKNKTCPFWMNNIPILAKVSCLSGAHFFLANLGAAEEVSRMWRHHNRWGLHH